MDRIELELYNLKNESEAQEIVDIVKEYYPQSPWPPTKEKVMSGGVIYYRAFFKEQQIGMTGYSIKTPTLVETVKTTIFKEFRGKGLGASLSQAIEDECQRKGVKKIISTVYYFNHVMVQIKLKQGYTIEGYHPDHEAPGFHEYSLGKVLK
jgi:RimJ/RimL family protein N-acetyltransferase